MHNHSLLAFVGLQEKITDRQRQVLAVYEGGDYTDQQVAEILEWPINRVSGRVGELLKLKAIIEKGSVLSNGSRRRVCGIKNSSLF